MHFIFKPSNFPLVVGVLVLAKPLINADPWIGKHRPWTKTASYCHPAAKRRDL